MKLPQIILLFISILGLAGAAAAQSLPEGEGQTIVAEVCNQCHELNIVTGMPRTEAQWEYVISVMVSMGAPVAEEEVPVVISYLTKHFGKPGAPPADIAEGEAR